MAPTQTRASYIIRARPFSVKGVQPFSLKNLNLYNPTSPLSTTTTTTSCDYELCLCARACILPSLMPSPVTLQASSHPSFNVKMEDRKRAAAGDDLAPPTKRQAVNGSKASADADMPWAVDLEVCTYRLILLSTATCQHETTPFSHQNLHLSGTFHRTLPQSCTASMI